MSFSTTSLDSQNVSIAGTALSQSLRKSVSSEPSGRFDGLTVTSEDPQQGKEFKAAIQENAAEKFPISSSDPLDSTRVTIPDKSNLQKASVEKIPSDVRLAEYLQTKDIIIDKSQRIGSGSFGIVFAAKVSDKDCVYKEQQEQWGGPEQWSSSLTNDPELNNKWWRAGDIAASRLEDLPHFAKSRAFILNITKQDGSFEKYFVPTHEAKNFGKMLGSEVKVQLLGQFIERAPGKELEKLLKEDSSFKPIEHFDSIANTLFGFLEKSFERNFIHRDLKSGNFIFDADPNSPTYQTGTVIDSGLGAVYGARHKMKPDLTQTEKSKNPFFSKKYVGTLGYKAPAVIVAGIDEDGEKNYGSEVDFHSAAVMLIELLDQSSFESVRPQSVKKEIMRDLEGKNLTSCDDYIAHSGSGSQLAQVLQQYPTIKTTIDLFFRVASPVAPETVDTAFEALKEHMAT